MSLALAVFERPAGKDAFKVSQASANSRPSLALAAYGCITALAILAVRVRFTH